MMNKSFILLIFIIFLSLFQLSLAVPIGGSGKKALKISNKISPRFADGSSLSSVISSPQGWMIEAQIKMQNHDKTQFIVTHYDYLNFTMVGVSNGQMYPHCMFRTPSNGWQGINASTSQLAYPNTGYNHFGCRYDANANKVSVFVNGYEADYAITTGSVVNMGGGTSNIGNENNALGLTVQMDELRFWTRPRSYDEILLFSQNLLDVYGDDDQFGFLNGLKSYYNFDNPCYQNTSSLFWCNSEYGEYAPIRIDLQAQVGPIFPPSSVGLNKPLLIPLGESQKIIIEFPSSYNASAEYYDYTEVDEPTSFPQFAPPLKICPSGTPYCLYPSEILSYPAEANINTTDFVHYTPNAYYFLNETQNALGLRGPYPIPYELHTINPTDISSTVYRNIYYSPALPPVDETPTHTFYVDEDDHLYNSPPMYEYEFKVSQNHSLWMNAYVLVQPYVGDLYASNFSGCCAYPDIKVNETDQINYSAYNNGVQTFYLWFDPQPGVWGDIYYGLHFEDSQNYGSTRNIYILYNITGVQDAPFWTDAHNESTIYTDHPQGVADLSHAIYWQEYSQPEGFKRVLDDVVFSDLDMRTTFFFADDPTNYTVVISANKGKLECVANATILSERNITLYPAVFTGQQNYTIYGKYDNVRFALFDGIIVWDPNGEVTTGNNATITYFVDDAGFGPINGTNPAMNATFTQVLDVVALPTFTGLTPDYIGEDGDIQLNVTGTGFIDDDFNFVVEINATIIMDKCKYDSATLIMCYIDGPREDGSGGGPQDIVDQTEVVLPFELSWRIFNPYSQENRSEDSSGGGSGGEGQGGEGHDAVDYDPLTAASGVDGTLYPMLNTSFWTTSPGQVSMFGGDTITGISTVSHLYTLGEAGTPECRLRFNNDPNGLYDSVFTATIIDDKTFECTVLPISAEADTSFIEIQFSQNGNQFNTVGYASGIVLVDDACTSPGELPWKSTERIDKGMDFLPSLVPNGTIYYDAATINATASSNATFLDNDRCCPSFLSDGELCGIIFNKAGGSRSQYAGLEFGSQNMYVNMVITSHGDPCNNLPSPYRIMYIPANLSAPGELVSRSVSNSQDQCKIIRGESGPTAICVDLITPPQLVNAIYLEFDVLLDDEIGAIMEFDARGLHEYTTFDLSLNAPNGSSTYNSTPVIDIGNITFIPENVNGDPIGTNNTQDHVILTTCFYHPTINTPVSDPGWVPCPNPPLSSVPPGNLIYINATQENGTWIDVSILAPPKGSYVLNMTAPTLYRTIGLPYTVLEGPVYTMISEYDTIIVPSGDTFSLPSNLVTLSDAGLNPLSVDPSLYPAEHEISVSVSFFLVSDNSTTSSTPFNTVNSTLSINTTVQGTANFTNLLFHNASSDSYAVVTFSASGLVSHNITIFFEPGLPTHLVFQDSPPTIHDNSALSTVPIVYMSDSAGNLILGKADFITASIDPVDPTKSVCSTAGNVKATDAGTGYAVFNGLGFTGQRSSSYRIRFSLNKDASVFVISDPIQVFNCTEGSDVPDETCSCTCNIGYNPSPADPNICSECPTGFYKDSVGSSECLECSARRSTSGQAADSISDCLCETEYYQDPENTEERTQAGCLACPVGAVCPGVSGNITFIDIYPEPGYWAAHSDPYTILKCPSADACLGGAKSSCLTGHDGPICAVCEEGYGTFGLRCTKCDQQEALNWSMVVIFFILVFGACIYLVKTANEGRSKASVYIRQAITFLQFMALCASLNIREWPSGIVTLFSASNVAMVDVNFLPSPECTINIDYYQTFLAYCLLPVFMIILPLAYLGFQTVLSNITAGRSKNNQTVINEFGDEEPSNDSLALDISDDPTLGVQDQKDRRQKIISQSVALITILINLTYPGTSKRILSIFDCSPYGDKSYLTSNLEVECFTAQHQLFTVIAYFMLIFYCIGVPVTFWFILWKNKDRHNDPEFQQRFFTLYDGYKPTHYYHESILMFRKLLFVVIIAFLRNQTQFQTFAALGALISFTLHTTWTQPYEDPIASKLELIGLFILYIVVTLAQMLYFSTIDIDKSPTLVLLLAGIIIAVTLIYLGYIFIYVVNYRLRQYFPNLHEKGVMGLSLSLQKISAKTSERFPNFSLQLGELNDTLLTSQLPDEEERAARQEASRKRAEQRNKFKSAIKTMGRRKSVDLGGGDTSLDVEAPDSSLGDFGLSTGVTTDVELKVSPVDDDEFSIPSSAPSISIGDPAAPPSLSGGLLPPPSLSGTNVSPRN